MGKQCSSNGLWGMRASGYSSRSSLYRGLFENGGKSPEQGAECEIWPDYEVAKWRETPSERRSPYNLAASPYKSDHEDRKNRQSASMFSQKNVRDFLASRK